MMDEIVKGRLEWGNAIVTSGASGIGIKTVRNLAKTNAESLRLEAFLLGVYLLNCLNFYMVIDSAHFVQMLSLFLLYYFVK